MKEYIERAKLMDHIELNAREHEEDYDAWQILGDVEDFPAADVVERKRGECKFCGGKDNAFHSINAETAAYSGIELAINRQGMLRVRVYDDYECETALPRSSEIIMIANCPNCGSDMRGEDNG